AYTLACYTHLSCLYSNDPPPTYTHLLSLHDALPILLTVTLFGETPSALAWGGMALAVVGVSFSSWGGRMQSTAEWWLLPVIFLRSEEHTSELQSRENLVCRLLLEKKKARLTVHRSYR